MNRNLIAATLASAGLLAGGNAHALEASEWSADPSEVLTIYWSGASAQDDAFERLFRVLCAADDPGTPGVNEGLDIFRMAGNQFAYFCEIDSAQLTLANTQRVALVKTSAGGSGQGVEPVIRGKELDFVSLQAIKDGTSTCTPGSPATLPAETSTITDPLTGGTTVVTFAAANQFDCTPVFTKETPIAGVADVDAKQFRDVPFANLPCPPPIGSDPLAKCGPLSDDELSTVDDIPTFIIVFGIQASTPLRNALQEVQFPTSSACHPQNPAYDDEVQVPIRDDAGNFQTTTNGESAACMPSLSQQQIRSVFAQGGVNDWGGLAAFGPGVPVQLGGFYDLAGDSLTSAVSTPPAETVAYTCQRVFTSGTQASNEIFWMRQRCQSPSLQWLEQDGPDDDGGVLAAKTCTQSGAAGNACRASFSSSSSGVRACLKAHTAANRWAIGINSTENQVIVDPDPSVDSGFRNIRVDGRLPTIYEAHQGRYELWMEATCIKRNDAGFYTGDESDLIDAVCGRAGQPAIVKALNADFHQTWGDGGLLSPFDLTQAVPVVPAICEDDPATPGIDEAQECVRELPVHTATKNGDNCLMPTAFWGQRAGEADRPAGSQPNGLPGND